MGNVILKFLGSQQLLLLRFTEIGQTPLIDTNYSQNCSRITLCDASLLSISKIKLQPLESKEQKDQISLLDQKNYSDFECCWSTTATFRIISEYFLTQHTNILFKSINSYVRFQRAHFFALCDIPR